MINITSSGSGSFLSSSTAGLSLDVNNCVFQCKTSYNASQITSDINNTLTSIGSLFDIKNAALVSSNSNTF